MYVILPGVTGGKCILAAFLFQEAVEEELFCCLYSYFFALGGVQISWRTFEMLSCEGYRQTNPEPKYMTASLFPSHCDDEPGLRANT